eukprot:CAMPEP_0171097408 /NCGR_PEP_ID=MMETSP0766_2-20121228/47529_1 /TAXON_ID=439317 /ORGANISM="Gambierdiscus australes, Strain CAWD 149" /LENGTH=68 /DNA_ID=CAMNT_0011556597 /DNA_START=81 /DNA_END=284 /DNA_ORIENTATION=-
MPACFALTILSGVAAVLAHGYTYDPSDRTDPFDTAAQAVTAWMKDSSIIKRKDDGWENNFCTCIQNGY